jgi:hypothetical protein
VKQTTALSAEARELIERAHLEPRPSEAACRRMELELAPLFAAGPGSVLLERLAEPRIGLGPRTWGPWQSFGGSGWGKLSFGAASVVLMVGAFWLGRTTGKQSESASSVPRLDSAPRVQDDAESPAAGHAFALAPLPTQPADRVLASSIPASAEAANAASPNEASPKTQPSSGVLPSSAGLPDPKAMASSSARAVDGITLLGQVELALREGHPRAALRELRGLDGASPPRLQHLARVLRAVALCDAGDLDEGRHLVAQIEELRTSSVFAARLKHACTSPTDGTRE